MRPRPDLVGLSATQKRRKRAMEKANRDHRGLIALLGDKCARCEATWADTQLQVDHVNNRPSHLRNRSSEVRGMRWDVRVKRYLQELAEGVALQVLCRPCNEEKGRAYLKALQEAPF